jgi:hypothetical protein
MSKVKQDDEKARISLEEVQNGSDRETPEGAGKFLEADEGLPPSGSNERIAAEKKLLRKLDGRLLPTIFVIYIMNYIDVCLFPLPDAITTHSISYLAEWYNHCTSEGPTNRFEYEWCSLQQLSWHNPHTQHFQPPQTFNMQL